MLTPVERVLILKGVDLLKDVGPRHLLGLANVTREVEMVEGDTIYEEADPADALYIVVEGRVALEAGGRATSEVGPGEAFGTWSLVDDSAREHRARCLESGRTLMLQREEFYDLASGDLTLLQELVRVLAKRLRELAAARPVEEARVEGEGIGKPEALVQEQSATTSAEVARPPTAGAALARAAAGKQAPAAEGDRGTGTEPDPSRGGIAVPEPIAPPVEEPPETSP
jgi:CRP-like cAMP-binding protein